MAYSGPPRVRTDLKEFEHFVCVEDLASDYGCRIDYRQMFGESKYEFVCCLSLLLRGQRLMSCCIFTVV